MISNDIYKLIQFRGRTGEMAYKRNFRLRENKAHEQVKLDSVDIKKVIDIVNNFLVKFGIQPVNSPKLTIKKETKIDYLKIMKDNKLNNITHIVWIKFTTDGYLGVVAASNDINFSIDNTSGKLIKSVKKKWNEDFVLVFPLVGISDGLRKDIECGIGNYLIEKGVPIIDFYSHRFQ